MTCQASGSWSTAPTCPSRKIRNYLCYKKKRSHLTSGLIACVYNYVSTSVAGPCGDPPTIPNGSRTFTGTTFGETATYTCDNGYQLSGSSTVTCQASGSWSPAPTCPSRKIRNYLCYNRSGHTLQVARLHVYMSLHL